MKSKKPPREIVATPPPVLREMDDEPLTAEERLWVREYVVKGETLFRRLRWNRIRREQFLARPNVQADIANWTDMFQHGDAILAKQAFSATLQLGGMLDEALLVIRRALRGMTPDADGKVPDISKLPDPAQVDLAWKILNACGVDRSLFKVANGTGVLADDAPGTGVQQGGREYDVDKTLTKEKARSALQFIAGLISVATADKDKIGAARLETKERQRVVAEQRREAGFDE